MSWYRTHLLPHLLSVAMGEEGFARLRPEIITQASGEVLEIGIGAGHNIPYYCDVTRLYGLEPSAELLAKAVRRPTELPVTFLHGCGEHIPLDDHTIDTVVTTWTLCSVADPKKTLQEIARVLRPCGRYLFLEHGLAPQPSKALLQNVLTPITKHFTGNCHLNRHIEGLMVAEGFVLEQLGHPQTAKHPLLYHTQGIARR